MKIKHFLSAAALCAAGTTFLLADDSLTGTVATWATQNSSLLTDSGTVSADGFGTYGGIVFNLITSSWLESSANIDIKNNYTLSDISITIEGLNSNVESTSASNLWTTSGAKAVLRDAAGNVVAMSDSGTVSGTLQTWTNFTGTDGTTSFTLDASQTYYVSFVTSSTIWKNGMLSSGKHVVSERLAGYSNSSIGDTDTSTGLLNSGTETVPPTTIQSGAASYSPGLSVTGTLTETVSTVTENKGTLNLYLLTGQSNSLGAVKGNPLDSDSLTAHATTKDQVMYWHENFKKDSTVYEGYSTEWEAVAPAMPNDTTLYAGNLCMGPEYGFAYLVAKNGWQELLSGNDGDFGIIKASLDGGDNSYWSVGGNGWSKVLTAASDAILQAYKDGYTTINIVGLMYLQGESNTDAEKSTAGTTLLTFVNNLQTAISNIGTELGITVTFDKDNDDYHVAAGESATWTNTTSTERSTASAKSIKTALADGVGEFIPTRDLTKITSGDNLGVHYDGQSQLTIGARYAYAEALRKGLVISDQMIRNFDINATLADSAGAAFHSGTRGDKMIATWDVASATITNVGEGVVELYGMKFDYDGSDYMQNGYTLIAGTVSDDAKAVDANTNRLVIGEGGITADKNVRLQTNLGIAGTQEWAIASGSTLTIDGMLFVELGVENVESALITKTGAGTLEFSADTILVAVTLNLDSITEVGEYQFKLFEGLDGQDDAGTDDTGTDPVALSLDEDGGIVSLAANDLVTAAASGNAYDFKFVLLNQEEVEATLGQDCFDFSSGILTINITQIPEPSLFGLLAGTLALALAGTRRRRNRR